MAAVDSRAVFLLTLVLLSLLGLTQAFFGFGRPPPPPPSPLAFLEANGCVPDNFTAGLPDAVTAATGECTPRRRFGRSPGPEPQPFGFSGRRGRRHHGRGGGGKATLLQCVADQLNITNDAGVDETALDSLLESLSDNTTFTDQLKTNADTCLAAMNSTTLTADQQGVYVLACLKKQQATDCMRQDENSTLCLNAMTLAGKCPIAIGSLVTSSVWWRCKGQATITALSSGLRILFSGGSLPTNLDSDSVCPTLESTARSVANCSLQASGLASGDAMGLTAVQTAIEGSSASAADQALQLNVLEQCRSRGADTTDAFLDCWAELAADDCVTSSATALALCYQSNTSTGSTSFAGRRFFGGGRRSGTRGGFRNRRGNFGNFGNRRRNFGNSGNFRNFGNFGNFGGFGRR